MQAPNRANGEHSISDAQEPAMTTPRHPAAYIRAAPGSRQSQARQAVADAARQRGWPAPAVYADHDGPDGPEGHHGLEGHHGPEGTSLAQLEAAIVAGRHDALMLAGQGMVGDGGPVPLARLLMACTKNGVAVELLPPAMGTAGGAAPPKFAARPFGRPRPHHQRPAVLVRLRVDALAGLFPDWRIWLDDHGWHARRRAGVFLQEYRPGSPAFCVHSVSEVDLAAQLRDQEKVDTRSSGRAAS
jgi:hypothetical protein